MGRRGVPGEGLVYPGVLVPDTLNPEVLDGLVHRLRGGELAPCVVDNGSGADCWRSLSSPAVDASGVGGPHGRQLFGESLTAFLVLPVAQHAEPAGEGNDILLCELQAAGAVVLRENDALLAKLGESAQHPFGPRAWAAVAAKVGVDVVQPTQLGAGADHIGGGEGRPAFLRGRGPSAGQ